VSLIAKPFFFAGRIQLFRQSRLFLAAFAQERQVFEVVVNQPGEMLQTESFDVFDAAKR